MPLVCCCELWLEMWLLDLHSGDPALNDPALIQTSDHDLQHQKFKRSLRLERACGSFLIMRFIFEKRTPFVSYLPFYFPYLESQRSTVRCLVGEESKYQLHSNIYIYLTSPPLWSPANMHLSFGIEADVLFRL